MTRKTRKDSVKATETQKPEGTTSEDSSTTRSRVKRKTTYERIRETDIPQEVLQSFLAEGYSLRFVRHAIDGRPDYRYLARREQEGFEFVSQKEIPEWYLDVFRVEDDRHRKGMLVSGDVVLMKVPLEVVEDRRAFYARETNNLVNAVDINVMKNKGFVDLGTKSRVNYKEPGFQS